jgi:rare lipoprotein A
MNTALLLLPLLVGGFTALQAGESRERIQTGVASWYGAECSHTASGERYEPGSLTAAHRTLPFGTMVAVKNIATGQTATLRINNRGPYRKGRVIDVSKGAAQQLGMMRSGVATVEVAVLK